MGETARDRGNGMVVPVIVVISSLLLVTIIREIIRVMWRRALLRTMEEFKRNQQQFIMAGNVIPAGSAQYFESGRWSMKWRDGRRDRFTRLTLRMDEASGIVHGTGQDCLGSCVVEGRFNAARDRIAWTQTYELRRGSILMEVWGYARREGEGGRVVSRGQYHLVDSLGRRGCFIMRPVLVESMFRGLLLTEPSLPLPDPVALSPIDDLSPERDLTCTICLEECEAEGAGMLPCRHVFHSACIHKWLEQHDDCPVCKTVLRDPGARVQQQQQQQRAGAATSLALLHPGLLHLQHSLQHLETELRNVIERVPEEVDDLGDEGIVHTQAWMWSGGRAESEARERSAGGGREGLETSLGSLLQVTLMLDAADPTRRGYDRGERRRWRGGLGGGLSAERRDGARVREELDEEAGLGYGGGWRVRRTRRLGGDGDDWSAREMRAVGGARVRRARVEEEEEAMEEEEDFSDLEDGRAGSRWMEEERGGGEAWPPATVAVRQGSAGAPRNERHVIVRIDGEEDEEIERREMAGVERNGARGG